MIILIPSSEGKNRIKRPMEIKFKNTDFKFMEDVEQVVRLLDLISNEDLRSICNRNCNDYSFIGNCYSSS